MDKSTARNSNRSADIATTAFCCARSCALLFASAFCALALASGVSLGDAKKHEASHIDYSMWFLSDVREAPECSLRYEDGEYDFGTKVTNPAMSCPDSFAWKVFTQIIRQGFWENWSTNRQTWPSDPWPLCKPGEPKENCCDGLVISNESWPLHCPVFPGATPGVPKHVVGTPSKAHGIPLSAASGGTGKWEDVPDNLKIPVIGDFQNELIYRNAPMMDYILHQEMYHVEGLQAIYQAHKKTLGAFAPYNPTIATRDEVVSQPRPTATVVFPIDAIMAKANWMAVDDARTLGIDPYDEENPFIVMDLVPKADDNAPQAANVETEPHVLLSFHISTKDIPNWYWATFEHVANQGRCDWLGCNDGVGYLNAGEMTHDKDSVGPLYAPSRNYVPPHQLRNVDGSTVGVFDIAKRYLGVDKISDELAALFKATGTGTSSEANRSGRPTPQDKAWGSYRLKGSQIDFVNPTGRPTLLGNSVTEAGFVNGASCISCHARAGVDERGLPLLDIFVDELSSDGIEKSFDGTPIEAWFYVNAYYGVNGERQPPAVRAAPTDFVYGIRNACPMKERAIGPAWCKNVKND